MKDLMEFAGAIFGSAFRVHRVRVLTQRGSPEAI
jgi:hypothetical protein